MGNSNQSSDTIKLNVRIKARPYFDGKFDSKCIIEIKYTQQETIKSITDKIIQFMNKKWGPVKFDVFRICEKDSFMKEDLWFDVDGYTESINKSITDYEKNHIIAKGFSIELRVNHKHKASAQVITCPHMISSKSKDPTQCLIYNSLMSDEHAGYTSDDLFHLNKYRHFRNEYESKPKCDDDQECPAFIRVEKGGHNTGDLCHLKLYRHPPRGRKAKLQENIYSFIHNQEMKENVDVHDRKNRDNDKTDEFIKALIGETIKNGYKYDLCLLCGKDDDCKHNVYQSNDKTLLGIADAKMKHPEHILRGSPLRRAQMLALIMYTGTLLCNLTFYQH